MSCYDYSKLLVAISFALGLSQSVFAMYGPNIGRFTSRDPIGFLGSQWNAYEYTMGRPLVGTDAFGLKCTINIAMGHYDEVTKHLENEPIDRYSSCNRFAPICCFVEDGVRICKEKYGNDSVIPNWPVSDEIFGFVYCKGVPKLLADSWEPLKSGASDICKGDCSCETVEITYKCSEDMKKCTARLKSEGKLTTDPCGGTVKYDCKSGATEQTFPNN